MSSFRPVERVPFYRRRRAPSGTMCPCCHQQYSVYFGRSHDRRPVWLRSAVNFLHCDRCDCEFRTPSVPAVVAGIALLGLAAIGGFGLFV